MSELMESPSGTGKVYAGEELVAEVEYEVQVIQPYEKRMTAEGILVDVPTNRRVDCRFSRCSAKIPPDIHRRLTLHMNDGRKVDFYMAANGPSAVGGIY